MAIGLSRHQTMTPLRSHVAGHLTCLDLLRGMAAICVVLYHFSSRISLGGLFEHAYLSVDFFFCLSGFVLARSYQGRLMTGQISAGGFLRLRLVRLMPLVVLGNTLAAAIDVFRPGPFSFAQHLRDIGETFLTGSLLLPTFARTTLEATTYPLNGPVWSLFFEFVANILFCAVARHAGVRSLSWVIIVASLTMLVPAAIAFGNVHFGPHPENFAWGFPRVLLSFFLGVLLANRPDAPGRGSPWLYVGALVVVIILPSIANPIASACYDLVAVTLVFPLIVSGAANCGSDRLSAALASWSGNASYPLYCLHYPLVRGIAFGIRSLGMGVAGNLAVALAISIALAAASSVVFNAFDQPVRQWLSGALRRRRGLA